MIMLSHASKGLFSPSCLLVGLIILVSVTASSQPEIPDSPRKDKIEIANECRIIARADPDWTIEDVASPEFENKFTRLENSHAVSQKEKVLWARCSIRVDEENLDSRWIFEPADSRTAFGVFDIYIRGEGSATEPWREYKTGSRRESEGQVLANRPDLWLPSDLSRPVTVYLRMEAQPLLTFSPAIIKADLFFENMRRTAVFQGGYGGVIVLSIIFNLLVFFWMKERSHFYYLLHITGMAIFVSINHGLDDFVAANTSLRQEFAVSLYLASAAVGIFAVYLFSRVFLMSSIHAKKFDLVLKILQYVALADVVFVFIAPFEIANALSAALGMSATVLPMIAAVVRLRSGFRPARFFLLAFIFSALGGFLRTFGIFTGIEIPFDVLQVGLAIEAALLNVALVDRFRSLAKERAKIRDLFGKYVTGPVRDELLAGRLPLDGELKDVTILFADIRGFTKLSEDNDPKLVVKLLNAYFAEMSETVQKHGGLVLQLIGDEIYAVFGAPKHNPNHPDDAFSAALEMRKRLSSLNEIFAEKQWPTLHQGIGVHSGEVVAASIGNEDRQSYMLVGDTVNLASRLQSMTRDVGAELVISQETRDRLTSVDLAGLPSKELQPTKVKGRDNPTQAFAFFPITKEGQ